MEKETIALSLSTLAIGFSLYQFRAEKKRNTFEVVRAILHNPNYHIWMRIPNKMKKLLGNNQGAALQLEFDKSENDTLHLSVMNLLNEYELLSRMIHNDYISGNIVQQLLGPSLKRCHTRLGTYIEHRRTIPGKEEAWVEFTNLINNTNRKQWQLWKRKF